MLLLLLLLPMLLQPRGLLAPRDGRDHGRVHRIIQVPTAQCRVVLLLAAAASAAGRRGGRDGAVVRPRRVVELVDDAVWVAGEGLHIPMVDGGMGWERWGVI